MSLVPHVRPLLDAVILVSGEFHSKDEAHTSGYRKVMVCLYNLRCASPLSEGTKLTVVSMWHGRVPPYSDNK